MPLPEGKEERRGALIDALNDEYPNSEYASFLEDEASFTEFARDSKNRHKIYTALKDKGYNIEKYEFKDFSTAFFGDLDQQPTVKKKESPIEKDGGLDSEDGLQEKLSQEPYQDSKEYSQEELDRMFSDNEKLVREELITQNQDFLKNPERTKKRLMGEWGGDLVGPTDKLAFTDINWDKEGAINRYPELYLDKQKSDVQKDMQTTEEVLSKLDDSEIKNRLSEQQKHKNNMALQNIDMQRVRLEQAQTEQPGLDAEFLLNPKPIKEVVPDKFAEVKTKATKLMDSKPKLSQSDEMFSTIPGTKDAYSKIDEVLDEMGLEGEERFVTKKHLQAKVEQDEFYKNADARVTDIMGKMGYAMPKEMNKAITDRLGEINTKYNAQLEGIQSNLGKESKNMDKKFESDRNILIAKKKSEFEKLQQQLAQGIQNGQITQEQAQEQIEAFQQSSVEEFNKMVTDYRSVKTSFAERYKTEINQANRLKSDMAKDLAAAQKELGFKISKDGKIEMTDEYNRTFNKVMEIVADEMQLQDIAMKDAMYQEMGYLERWNQSIAKGMLGVAEVVGAGAQYFNPTSESADAFLGAISDIRGQMPQADYSQYGMLDYMTDLDFIINTGLEQLPIMAAPTMAGLGTMKLANGALGKATALGAKSRTAIASVVGGSASRLVENKMEVALAHHRALKEGKSFDEAYEIAKNTDRQLQLLFLTDAAQFYMGFGRVPNRLSTSGASTYKVTKNGTSLLPRISMRKVPKIGGELGLQFFSEGMEESYQEYVVEKQFNPLLSFSDFLASQEGKQIFATGGLMGTGFGAIGMTKELQVRRQLAGVNNLMDKYFQSFNDNEINLDDIEGRFVQLNNTLAFLKEKGALSEQEVASAQKALQDEFERRKDHINGELPIFWKDKRYNTYVGLVNEATEIRQKIADLGDGDKNKVKKQTLEERATAIEKQIGNILNMSMAEKAAKKDTDNISTYYEIEGIPVTKSEFESVMLAPENQSFLEEVDFYYETDDVELTNKLKESEQGQMKMRRDAEKLIAKEVGPGNVAVVTNEKLDEMIAEKEEKVRVLNERAEADNVLGWYKIKNLQAARQAEIELNALQTYKETKEFGDEKVEGERVQATSEAKQKIQIEASKKQAIQFLSDKGIDNINDVTKEQVLKLVNDNKEAFIGLDDYLLAEEKEVLNQVLGENELTHSNIAHAKVKLQDQLNETSDPNKQAEISKNIDTLNEVLSNNELLLNIEDWNIKQQQIKEGLSYLYEGNLPSFQRQEVDRAKIDRAEKILSQNPNKTLDEVLSEKEAERKLLPDVWSEKGKIEFGKGTHQEKLIKEKDKKLLEDIIALKHKKITDEEARYSEKINESLNKIEDESKEVGDDIQDKTKPSEQGETKGEQQQGDIETPKDDAGQDGGQEDVGTDTDEVSEPTDVEEETAKEKIQEDIAKEEAGIEDAEEDTVEQDGVTYTRQKPLVNKIVGKVANILFSKGKKGKQKAEYTLIEASDLQPSHLEGQENPLFFVKEAQPKNRAEGEVMKKADATKGMDLDSEQLGVSPNAFFGAPVVNQRGEVIQGNGRAGGIKYYYKNADDNRYQNWLKDNAATFGMTAEQVASMKQPVLVAMANVSDQEMIRLGQYQSSQLEDAPLPTAIAKGRWRQMAPKHKRSAMDKLLSFYAKGKTLNTTIRESVKQLSDFLKAIGVFSARDIELGFKDGNPTSDFVYQIQRFILQPFFENKDNPDLVDDFDALPFRQKDAIIGAVLDIYNIDYNIHRSAKVKEDVQEAIKAAIDFNKYKKSQKGKATVKSWLGQQIMFGDHPIDQYSPNALRFVEMLDSGVSKMMAKKKAAGEKRVTYAETFKEFFEKLADGLTTDIFSGPENQMSKQELYDKMFEQYDSLLAQVEHPNSHKAMKRKKKGKDMTIEGEGDTMAQTEGSGESMTQQSTEQSQQEQTMKEAFFPRVKPQKIEKRTPEQEKKAKTMKRQDIRAKLIDAANAIVKYGKKGLSSKALGDFNPTNMLTRVKKAGDLRTLVHEIGHHLDFLFNIVPKDNSLDAELYQFSIYGSSPRPGMTKEQAEYYVRREGIAEFFVAYMINPKEAQAKAPNLFAHFEDRMKNNPRKDAQKVFDQLLDASEDLILYENLSASERYHATVAKNAASMKISERIKAGTGSFFQKMGIYNPETGAFHLNIFDRFKTAFFSQLTAVQKAEKVLNKMLGLGESADIYTAMRLYNGVGAKVENILEQGMVRKVVQYDKNGKATIGYERALSSNGQRMNIDFLIEPFISNYDIMRGNPSQKQIYDDMKEASKYMVAQRTLEYYENFNKEALKQVRELKKKLKDKISVAERDAISIKIAELEAQLEGQKRDLSGLGSMEQNDVDAANEILAEFEKMSPSHKRKIQEAAKRYREFARSLLDYSKASGLLSQEEYDRIVSEGVNYVAMHRLHERSNGLESDLNDHKGMFVDIRKRAKGGTQERLDPYENLIAQAIQVVDSADRNDFLASFAGLLSKGNMDFAGNDPNIEKDIVSLLNRELGLEKGQDRDLNADNMYDAIEKLRAKITLADDKAKKPLEEDLAKISQFMNNELSPIADFGTMAHKSDKDKANVITAYIDGKAQHWALDADIAKSIKSLYEVSEKFLGNSWWAKLARFVAKGLRIGVTYSPVFAARNIVRDTQHRLMISADASMRDILNNAIFNVTNPFKGDEDFSAKDLYQVYGGDQSGYYRKDRETYYKTLNKAIRGLAKDKKVIMLPAKAFEAYEKMLTAAENANRMAEFKTAYKKAIKNGKNEYEALKEAAFQSRNLIDFAEVGSVIEKFRDFIPFFNASIQGSRRLFSAMMGKDQSAASFYTKWAIFAVLPSMLTYAHAVKEGDDDEYTKLPAWRRDLFFNIKYGDKWVTIPKPFELGVFASGIERFYDYAIMGNKNAFDGYFKGAGDNINAYLSGSFATSVLPFMGTDDFTPLFLNTIFELRSNYSNFYQREIVPKHEENLALSERKNMESKSSRLSQWLSKIVGFGDYAFDPRYGDYVVKNWFGYFGKYALSTSNIWREEGEGGSRWNWANDSGFMKEAGVYDIAPMQNILSDIQAYELGYTEYGERTKELMYGAAKENKSKEQAVRDLVDFVEGYRSEFERKMEIYKRFSEGETIDYKGKKYSKSEEEERSKKGKRFKKFKNILFTM